MTDEYLVHTRGFINVEAESKEEAEENAREAYFHRPDSHEVESYSAEKLGSVEEDPKAQVQIIRCGSNLANGSYDLMTSESALDLLYMANRCMSKDFVGDHDRNLLYNLAQHILAMYDWDDEQKEELFEKVEEIAENYDENDSVRDVMKEKWVYEDEPQQEEEE